MACLTAARSIGDVVAVVAVAKGAVERNGGGVRTDIGICGATVAGAAATGTAAPAAGGTSESGAIFRAGFGAARFGAATALPCLSAGRDRGNGVNPGVGAADCADVGEGGAVAPARRPATATSIMSRNPCTCPPAMGVSPLCQIVCSSVRLRNR
jgi:hypothetical protein